MSTTEVLSNTNSPSLKKKQIRLYDMSMDYLIDNFWKFSEENRIRISLVIATKYIPTKVEGDQKGDTKIIIMRSEQKQLPKVEDGITTEPTTIPRQISV